MDNLYVCLSSYILSKHSNELGKWIIIRKGLHLTDFLTSLNIQGQIARFVKFISISASLFK